MSLTIIAEDGTGVEDANSYTTLAAAEEYHLASLSTEAWDEADDDRKTKLLVAAARILDTQFSWFGEKDDANQAMEWPRTGVQSMGPNSRGKIPGLLKAAQAELANDLATAGTFQVRPAGENGADLLKGISLGNGAIDLEFQDQAESEDSNKSKTAVSPYVTKMLGALGEFKYRTSGLVKTYRG